jgi:hypothetical protein
MLSTTSIPTGVKVMVFNATFNNISAISWWSVLLLKETDKLYHTMLHRVHLAGARFELTTFVVIGTDCIGSYKSNNHKMALSTYSSMSPIM